MLAWSRSSAARPLSAGFVNLRHFSSSASPSTPILSKSLRSPRFLPNNDLNYSLNFKTTLIRLNGSENRALVSNRFFSTNPEVIIYILNSEYYCFFLLRFYINYFLFRKLIISPNFRGFCEYRGTSGPRKRINENISIGSAKN